MLISFVVLRFLRVDILFKKCQQHYRWLVIESIPFEGRCPSIVLTKCLGMSSNTNVIGVAAIRCTSLRNLSQEIKHEFFTKIHACVILRKEEDMFIWSL